MKVFKSSFIFCFICIMQSCNEKPPTENELAANNTDTVIKDIPTRKLTESYRLMKYDIENKLGLYSLENGFDSLEIRIWYGYAFSDTEQLVIIKNKLSQWSAETVLYNYVYDDKRDSILSIPKTVREQAPKSGWDNFIEKLMELKITTLPDMLSIPEYYLATDGDVVTVEVATDKRYRVYSYQNPFSNQDQFRQAKNMEKLSELIESEFDFRRLRKL